MVARLMPKSVCLVNMVAQLAKRAKHEVGQHLFDELTRSKKGPGISGRMLYSRARELIKKALTRIGVSPNGFGTQSCDLVVQRPLSMQEYLSVSCNNVEGGVCPPQRICS